MNCHLSGYFVNNPNVDEHELTEIGRRDIPSVLLENHFLELFSKPMEEREAFLPSGKGMSVRQNHKVVFASGKGGAIFDHFELNLPHGTTVSRIDPRSIQLKTDRFSMSALKGLTQASLGNSKSSISGADRGTSPLTKSIWMLSSTSARGRF